MTTRGTAYALATAIYAGTKGQAIVDIEELEHRVYRTVDGTAFGADEARADLYAQLAEKLTADTSFQSAVDIIQAAMDSTLQHLPGSLQ